MQTSHVCLGCSVTGSTWFLGWERDLHCPGLGLSYPILCHLLSTARRCNYVSPFSCSFCRNLNETAQKWTGHRTVTLSPSLGRGSLNSSLLCCPGVRVMTQPLRVGSTSLSQEELYSLLTSRRHQILSQSPKSDPGGVCPAKGVCSTPVLE